MTAIHNGTALLKGDDINSQAIIVIICCSHILQRFRWSRVTVLAFGTQVRGFAPGRSPRIFRAKKSWVRLPSEGK